VYRVVARGWIKALQPERQADTVGVIGRIYQSGEYHLAQNIADDPYLLVSNQEHALENWAGAWVPVRSTSSVIGVLEVLAETPRKFNENDIRQLTTLAEIFGNAIHRARLYKRTKKQVKRLTTLRNIDTAISGNFDLRVTLQLLVDHAIKQLGADAANILLVSQTDKKLKYFVGNGFNTPFFQNTKMLSSEGIPGKAVREHRTKFVSLPNREISCSRKEWFEEEKFRSYYCAPLTAKGETLGVLEVFHRKPFTATLDWQDFLQTLAGQATIAIDNSQLFEDLKRSNQELAFAYDTTLEGWGKALELRDKDTQGHTLNVTELTLKLARRIGIDESQLIHVYRGALLHDIGKMGIPDNILRKPGPLTKKEWEIMRQHPQFAYDMIAPIPYLHPALDIPYCHHERWDGEGYPRGLKGKEIPLAARIFSIIDVWDALRSDRPYRESWDKKTIIDYIKNESGTRFDPEIVEVFLDMVEEI
jgi:putative nucleotidyltransferase with HDIG domain